MFFASVLPLWWVKISTNLLWERFLSIIFHNLLPEVAKIFKALFYIFFSYCVLLCIFFIFVFERFKVFTAVAMKNTVFCDVGPCRSCVNRRFGGRYHLHLQGSENPLAKNHMNNLFSFLFLRKLDKNKF
jgi:hypothetical protein